MKPNEKIKARRQELGFTDIDVFERVGLSDLEYSDLEGDESEVHYVYEVVIIKKICDVLQLNLLELYGLTCAFCENKNEYLDEYSLPRNVLIKKRRIDMNMSVEEVDEKFEFFPVNMEKAEADADVLEEYPYDAIAELSNILHIPMQILLNVKCSKCGR